jgi:sugar phosphate isomerase/epimerase
LSSAVVSIPHNTPLSLAHLSELDVPPLALVELAARAGFASIGLRTSPASAGGVEYPLRSAVEQAEMRKRLSANGIKVLEVEMVPLSAATRVADYKPMIETGAAIGATRLTVGGDSADFSLVAERLAEMAELAQPYGIAIDLEFMPFRAVQSLAHAVEVVRRARHPNAHILIDALHVFRSGTSPAEFAQLDPAMLGPCQLCDAPVQAPPAAELVVEARTRRLLPGQGGLALDALLDALPAGTALGVEVPLGGQRPDLDPGARLALLVKSTREFLQRRHA